MSDAQRPNSPDQHTVASGVEGQADAPESTKLGDQYAEPDFETDVDGNPIPSPEVLADQALPAIYTRSPRLVQVVATVAFASAALGFLIGIALPAGFASSRLAAGALMALAGALLGGLIAGIVVVTGEAREARAVAARKVAAIDDWLIAHPDGPTAGAGESAIKESSP